MYFSKVKLYYNTVKFLKFKQLYYRIFYLLRNRFLHKNYNYNKDLNVVRIYEDEVVFFSDNIQFYYENKFVFLNVSHSFNCSIDWNFTQFGKLWTYNLNYFDYLNQNNLSREKGLELIYDYIQNDQTVKVGKEPYPISLRNINWIKFISRNKIQDENINKNLFKHYLILLDNLEYHLLGNHLLENGFSLLFGAYFFQNEKFYKKARKIIINELNEQILNDGAHFELSSMYHQIILFRLLESISLIDRNKWKNDMSFYTFLKNKAITMLSFLKAITYNNGDVPMVNDSAYGIAPTSQELFHFGQSLGLEHNSLALDESGYRKFENDNYELFVDVGEVGPKYQAGHSHADMFNFELYYRSKPFIVDTGTSTYENNQLRKSQRGTDSHNTVIVNSMDQSQVWSAFRVGKRARILKSETKPNKVRATHDGYRKIAGLHTREFYFKDKEVIINDTLSKKRKNQIHSMANFHFHSNIHIICINDNVVEFNDGVKMIFESSDELKLINDKYQLAVGFNKTVEADKLRVRFSNDLTTYIEL